VITGSWRRGSLDAAALVVRFAQVCGSSALPDRHIAILSQRMIIIKWYVIDMAVNQDGG
jgi:hypothetical protein